jgi:Chaperone for flagella basal body P-ring formation
MKWISRLLISVLLIPAARSVAEAGCAGLSVRPRVDAVREELTLADLLPSETCASVRQAALRVSLGKAPRAGVLRVIDGRQIRAMVGKIAHENGIPTPLQIPDRVLVRRAGATKSCLEIADFLAGAGPSQDLRRSARSWREKLECGAIGGIAEDAELELVKTGWNTGLQRWEFLLRCVRPEDCVPFLVSAREEEPARSTGGNSPGAVFSPQSVGSLSLLVKAGDTALLTWDQSGIRVTLPVTCLDAGGLGQYVRVRLKNAPQILRAEVVGARAVQVKL